MIGTVLLPVRIQFPVYIDLVPSKTSQLWECWTDWRTGLVIEASMEIVTLPFCCSDMVTLVDWEFDWDRVAGGIWPGPVR